MATEEKTLLVKLVVERTQQAQQYEKARQELAKIKAELAATSTETEKVGRASASAGKGLEGTAKGLDAAFGRNRVLMIQNASYQVQDFFVQINGGMDAMRSLSQQLPQVLGAFGAMGAAVGIVAAVLPQVVSALFNVGETEAAIKKVKEQMEGLGEATDFVDRMSRQFDEEAMIKKLSRMTDSAKELTLAYLKTAEANAIVIGQEAQRNIANFNNELDKLVQQTGQWAVQGGMSDRFNAFGLSPENAKKAAGLIRELRDEGADYGRIAMQLSEINDESNPKWNEYRKQLIGSGKALAEQKRNLEEYAAARRTVEQSLAGRVPYEEPKKTGATRAAARETDDYARVMKELQNQIIRLEQGPGSISALTTLNEQYRLGLIKIKPELIDNARALAARIDEINAETEAQKKQSDALKAWISEQDKAWAAEQRSRDAALRQAAAYREMISKLEDAANPMRNWARENERLYELYYKGDLSLQALTFHLGQNNEALRKASGAADEFSKNAVKMLDLEQGLKSLAIQGIGGLADALVNADKGFKQFAANFLRQIAKMILQAAILKSLAGTAFGNFLGIPAIPKAKGDAFASPLGLPQGVYSQPTFFRMPQVQKFAKGGAFGVLGEAGPEAIMPLKRGADGKLGVEGAAVNINVINNAGADVQVEREGDNISIIIEKVRSALTKDVRSGGNAFAGALQNTYGLNRAYG